MAFCPDYTLKSRGHPPFLQTGSAIRSIQAVVQDDTHFSTSPVNFTLLIHYIKYLNLRDPAI